MARRLTIGHELNTATNNVEVSTSGSPTISSTTVRSGGFAGRCLNATAFTPKQFAKAWVASNQSGPFWGRIYIRFATLPNDDTTVMAFFESGGTQPVNILYSLANNCFQLFYNDLVTQVTGNSATLTTGVWYRLELKIDKSAAGGSHIAEAKLDGTTFATASNLTITNGVIELGWGVNLEGDGATTMDVFFDDIAVNDSTTGGTQTGYPGDEKVIYLRPDSAGDVNTFGTQTGGTAGAANNFTRVNETPPDNATSFNGSSTLNQEDLFNFGASGIGAGDTVNVVEVHGRYRNSTADATGAIKFEIEKAASGTKQQSAAIVPNTTAFNTDTTTNDKIAPLVTYVDPDGAAWTQTTLDSLQAGYKLTTGPGTAGRRIDVTSLWVVVGYTPAGGTNYTQSLSASYSASGSLAKAGRKSLSATFSTAGLITGRAIGHSLGATYRSTGIITARAVARNLTATFSVSGLLNKFSALTSFTASFITNGSLSRKPGKMLSGTYLTSGSIIRATGRSLSATYSASGSLVRLVSRLFSATFSSSGSVASQKSGSAQTKSLSATYQTSGTLSKQTQRVLGGQQSTSGMLQKATKRNILATFSGSGVLSKLINRNLTATFSVSGSLTKLQVHTALLTATYKASGVIVGRAIKRSLGGFYVASGSLNKSTSRLLTATARFSGLLFNWLPKLKGYLSIIITGLQDNASVSGQNTAPTLASPTSSEPLSSDTSQKDVNTGSSDATMSSDSTNATLD